jgi:isopenicillin-N epimerase
MPQETLPSPLEEWCLAPNITHLSHGSYGALPRLVQNALLQHQTDCEERPDSYLFFTAKELLSERRRTVARRFGSPDPELVLLQGASAGMTTVLRSFPWKEGDEVLYSNHGYRLVENCLLHLARTRGIVPRRIPVPFPLVDTEDMVKAFEQGIQNSGGKLRLMVACHVTSPTALVFPAARLVALGRSHGLPVLIDGAHVPGHFDLDITALGADFYVGNLHKWIAGPRGTGFLHAKPRWHEALEPPVVTAHTGSFTERFLWAGTASLAPFLALDVALAHAARLDSLGWQARSHALLSAFRNEFFATFGTTPTSPDSPTFTGAMQAFALPARWKGTPEAEIHFRRLFFEKHGIEVPFTTLPDHDTLFVRPSAHAYTQESDFQTLLAALKFEFL